MLFVFVRLPQTTEIMLFYIQMYAYAFPRMLFFRLSYVDILQLASDCRVYCLFI